MTAVADAPAPASGAQGTSIFDTTICLLLNRGTFGITRKAKGAAQTLVAETLASSAEMVSLNKRLFKADEYKAIKTLDGSLREYLDKVSLPSLLKGGSYAIPIALVEQVDTKIRSYTDERKALVAKLQTAWPGIVEQASADLGIQLFDPRNYPNADRLGEKFYVEHRWIDYGTPNRLKAIKASIWADERAKAEADVRNAKDAAIADVRGRALDLVSHVVERLTPGEDGKKKVFRDSLVTNVKEFLDIFPVLNTAAGDTESAPLIEKARLSLAGIDSKLLRDDDLVRRKVAEQFAEIKTVLDTMVTTKTRKIVFEDDEQGAA